ncbi:hypothetical protein Xoosp13_373 [Xanthomonas phage Xoo-sp13]|nr:hypothetical protein Xoosp13_373 [Xanthomonas phage Xoo-sp13]
MLQACYPLYFITGSRNSPERLEVKILGGEFVRLDMDECL